jgi:hypothetical protein
MEQWEGNISSFRRDVHAVVISYRTGQVISVGQAQRTSHGQSLGQFPPGTATEQRLALTNKQEKVRIAKNLEAPMSR